MDDKIAQAPGKPNSPATGVPHDEAERRRYANDFLADLASPPPTLILEAGQTFARLFGLTTQDKPLEESMRRLAIDPANKENSSQSNEEENKRV